MVCRAEASNYLAKHRVWSKTYCVNLDYCDARICVVFAKKPLLFCHRAFPSYSGCFCTCGRNQQGDWPSELGERGGHESSGRMSGGERLCAETRVLRRSMLPNILWHNKRRMMMGWTTCNKCENGTWSTMMRTCSVMGHVFVFIFWRTLHWPPVQSHQLWPGRCTTRRLELDEMMQTFLHLHPNLAAFIMMYEWTLGRSCFQKEKQWSQLSWKGPVESLMCFNVKREYEAENLYNRSNGDLLQWFIIKIFFWTNQ